MLHCLIAENLELGLSFVNFIQKNGNIFLQETLNSCRRKNNSKHIHKTFTKIFTLEVGMINRFKNLKIVQKLKEASPKLKWLMFNQMQDYKINSEYIDMICSDASKETNSDNDRLEAMVRESLIKEFSPSVKNMKSYELLVDAIVHNLKKKQLQATDNQEEIA